METIERFRNFINDVNTYYEGNLIDLFPYVDMLNDVLKILNDVEKLKKAIEILKEVFEIDLDKKLLSGDFPLVYRHVDLCRYAKNLSQQEYDLLKEVLSND